jgi:hypothetical protein
MRRANVSLSSFAVALGLCLGCGTSAPVSVAGKVSLDGKPLARATVMFSPSRPNAPGPYVGETDQQGKFALGPTDKPAGGAAPGDYLVFISTVKGDPTGLEMAPAPTQKEIVPTAFRDGSTRFTVPEGGTKDANFDMKSR